MPLRYQIARQNRKPFLAALPVLVGLTNFLEGRLGTTLRKALGKESLLKNKVLEGRTAKVLLYRVSESIHKSHEVGPRKEVTYSKQHLQFLEKEQKLP